MMKRKVTKFYLPFCHQPIKHEVVKIERDNCFGVNKQRANIYCFIIY